MKRLVTFTALWILSAHALPLEAQFAQEVEIDGYPARSHGTFFVNEEGGPIVIQEASAYYINRASAYLASSDGLDYPQSAHIRVRIKAKGENIAAVRYVILIYDLFKEHMGSYSVIQTDGMYNPEMMEVVITPPNLNLFRNYGVVGVFARKARLHDGRIWDFNEELVLRTFTVNLIGITKKHLEYQANDENVGKVE